eukprot:6210970-Pleurochrysis_carterae.AAC.1
MADTAARSQCGLSSSRRELAPLPARLSWTSRSEAAGAHPFDRVALPQPTRSTLREIADVRVGDPKAETPTATRGARAVSCPPVRPLVRPAVTEQEVL